MFELTRAGNVFTLTLCHGENRFTLDSLQKFNGQLDQVMAQAGDGPGALIVTGAEKYWSNGIDLEALMKASSQEQQAFLPTLNGLLGRLVSFPLPTAAALNGHAFAGGALLALACDYRVMRTGRGWFCLPEVDLGVPFDLPMVSLIKAKLRPDVARNALLSGRRYTAEEGLEAGIVDQVCEHEQLLATTTELLAPLAEKARGVFTRIKQDLYGGVAKELGHPS